MSDNIEESIFIGKVLSVTAASASASIDKFSTWLIAGFGAAFALILTNIATVSSFISVDKIKCGVMLYLMALVFSVLQRLIASQIQSGVAAIKELKDVDSPKDLNPENLMREFERVTFYPMKWLIQYQNKRLEEKDFAANGRMQAYMVQVQSLLVIIQAGLVVFSIMALLTGLSA